MRCYSELICAFETKSVTDEVATFTGIASTSDVDAHNDVVEAGAFEPIARKASGEPDVLMLRDHDRSSVIGGWKSFVQQGTQLFVEGELCLAVEKARETHVLIKKGYLSGISVGFNVPDGGIKWDRSTGRRTIRKAILKECSIVALPANPGARITSVKSEIADFISTLGLDESDAELLIREGFKALVDARAKDAKKPFGDVSYADPGYQDDGKKRYPVDTEARIRAAWSYINMPRNQQPYTSDQVAKIKARIVAAWKDKIDSAGPPAAQKAASLLPFIGIDDHYPLDEAMVSDDVRALLAQLKGQSHV
jgi:Escherichia/Staphylococcus phage prohead protease